MREDFTLAPGSKEPLAVVFVLPSLGPKSDHKAVRFIIINQAGGCQALVLSHTR